MFSRAHNQRLSTAFSLIGLFFLASCGQPAPRSEFAGSKALPPAFAAPTVSERPGAWEGDPIQITALTSSGTSMTLHVRLPEGATAPDGSESCGFNLTLPLGASVSTDVVACTVGGTVINFDHAAAARLIRLDRRGLMRNWPIWHLDLLKHFWEPLHSIGGRNGAVDVTIVLSVKPTEAAAPKSPTPKDSPMRRLAEKFVANPGDLDRWETAPAPAEPRSDPRALAPDGKVWLKAFVETDGLSRITPESLQSAGLIKSPAELERIRIFSLGKPVPAMAVAESSPARPAGLYFYGLGSASPYSRQRAYWLTASAGSPAVRWQFAESTSGTQPADLNVVQARSIVDHDVERMLEQTDLLSITGIDWVDRKVETSPTLEVAIPIHRPVAEEKGHIRAKLEFIAYGDNPSEWAGTGLSLSSGDRELARWKMTESPKQTWAAQLPASILRDGTVTLTLRVTDPTTATLADADSEIWFDRMELDYPARPTMLDGRFVFGPDSTITPTLGRLNVQALGGPADPIALEIAGEDVRQIRTESGGLIVSNERGRRTEIFDPAVVRETAVRKVVFDDDLLAAASHVDYLIIVHSSLRSAIEPLLELNRDRGLATKVVDIEALYDLFGDGVLNPEVIRAYFKHAMTNWPGGAPEYVLLFGDSNSDFLNKLRNRVPNLVPSYSYQCDETWASDAWFTMFCGDDKLPDTMIGRISVNTMKDAHTVIEKTVRYARNRPLGPWRARMTYVADETERAEDFRAAAETIRSHMTLGEFGARCIYLDELPMEDNWYQPDEQMAAYYADKKKMMKVSGAATEAILDAMNQGTAMLDFLGHGSPNIWCDERIWFGGDSQNRDTQHLKPADGRYPFIVNYTCNTGAIDYPDPPWNLNISEDLMRTPDAGAVGMFVPSGPGTTPGHLNIARQWRKSIFSDNLRGFGEISTLARLRVAAANGPRDLIYMYILLGDPALGLQLTERWQPLTLSARAVNPDATNLRHEAMFSNIVPASGEAMIWVEDMRGRRLWEGPAVRYKGGQHSLRFEVPPSFASPGQVRVCVYGWNESEGQDFAAGALVEVERPRPRIESVEMRRENEQQLRVRVAVKNPGAADSGNMTLSLVRTASREEIAHEDLRLVGGETHTVRFTIPLTIDPAAERLEVVLTPGQPPDDPIAPVAERIGYKVSGDTLTTETLVSAARVRILPESISHDPDPVTEGHTITVTFKVENAGQGPSNPMIAELLDGPPDKGGSVLPIQSVLPETKIPALGAGRTWPVALRWDPSLNAGVRKVWIRLKPVSGPPDRYSIEQVAEHSMFVRTKCKLARVREVKATRTAEDVRLNRYKIHAFVQNSGQTDARGVEVNFYTGPERREDQFMGKVDLKVVPAGGIAEAVLIWTHDTTKFPNLDTSHLPVTIEMRLLGSTQRTSG